MFLERRILTTFCCVAFLLMVLINALPGNLGSYTVVNGCRYGTNNTFQATAEDEAEAVRGLLRRLIAEKAADFLIQVNLTLGPKDRDTFQIESVDHRILITGSRGYAVASGINHYLKYFCGCHVSWSGDQLSLPEELPRVTVPVKITSNDKYKYYQNVCTASYSTVWWNWSRWEREIDWMALNGINLPLAFTAQEVIWKKVFKTFNFTDHDIDEFFTGPAFLAWNRMGNLQAWAGPLSDGWHSQQMKLQHHIVERMRAFGMTPVIPAFSGRVPPSIHRIFPNASVTNLDKNWGHFDVPYGKMMFLQPTDPLFMKIGVEFLRSYIDEFGTNHVYNTDLFNEMPPPSNETEYLRACGQSVYRTMIAVDHQAKWLLQGWMFFSNQEFWQPAQAKAFLTSVPIGRMIVLDLQSELYPQYHRLNSYYGQPFIWCMLHNYGGVLGLYGNLDQINTGPFEGRSYPNSTMVGTGLTPEGIETNDMMYELMNEMEWRPHPVDLDIWISDFVSRRYGFINMDVQNAWQLLKRSVYNASASFRNHGKYILTTRPSLKMKPYVWYDSKDVFEAWKLFVKASSAVKLKNSELFRHDLIDVTRQALQLVMDIQYGKLLKEFIGKDLKGLKNVTSSILSLYDDSEELLSSDVHFLLGPWLQAAGSWVLTPLEKKQYDYNARNQVTLWGPSGQLRDYANKQWAGLVSGYYRKRWKCFLTILKICLETGSHFNQRKFNDQLLFQVEIPFTLGDESYPVDPKGDPIEISERLLKKYMKTIDFLQAR